MIKLGIIMDPISTIKIQIDSSFAMLVEAQRRGYEIYYMEINSLYLLKNEAYGCTTRLTININKNCNKLYEFGTKQNILLKTLDVILMRKDPPIDIQYIYATYILDKVEYLGTLIINKPQSLRDCNEKLFTTNFPKLIPDTLITQNHKKIIKFYQKHEDIILKPLDKMGGSSIFRIKKNDPNVNVIIEVLTKHEQEFCIVQKYLTNINNGDKRILIIDGKPIPYCLARIPIEGETRANLSAGGYGEIRALTDNDWKITKTVIPLLKAKGLIFVGLDVIGDNLTEINITSPTCIREIEHACPDISITKMLFEAIEKYLF